MQLSEELREKVKSGLIKDIAAIIEDIEKALYVSKATAILQSKMVACAIEALDIVLDEKSRKARELGIFSHPTPEENIKAMGDLIKKNIRPDLGKHKRFNLDEIKKRIGEGPLLEAMNLVLMNEEEGFLDYDNASNQKLEKGLSIDKRTIFIGLKILKDSQNIAYHDILQFGVNFGSSADLTSIKSTADQILGDAKERIKKVENPELDNKERKQLYDQIDKEYGKYSEHGVRSEIVDAINSGKIIDSPAEHISLYLVGNWRMDPKWSHYIIENIYDQDAFVKASAARHIENMMLTDIKLEPESELTDEILIKVGLARLASKIAGHIAKEQLHGIRNTAILVEKKATEFYKIYRDIERREPSDYPSLYEELEKRLDGLESEKGNRMSVG